MSWRATAKVKDLRDGLTRSEKFVLLILADYHNEETGQCDPSIGRLAGDVLMTERACQLVLQSLDAKGFIRIERRASAVNRQSRTNQYWLTCLDDMGGEGETISPPQGQGEGDPPIRGRVIPRSGEGDPPIRGEGDPPITQTVIKNRKRTGRGTETRARAPAPADLARQIRLMKGSA